jgi:ribosomal protein S18 acetylase RimI-like enzyme
VAKPDLSSLNNPIWHSLKGPHAKFAVGNGLARCYQPQVSVFYAISEPSDAAFRDLRDLVGTDGVARMLSLTPEVGHAGWNQTFGKEIMQMVWERPLPPVAAPEIMPLGDDDVPEMTRLVEATKPGPWAPRTIDMGRYYGIRVDGKLAAMAGERMCLPGFTEVSAIAVWPEFRGRGLAQKLALHVASAIAARGERAFLHLFADNTPARTLYEKLGFVARPQKLFFVSLERI